MTLQRVGVTDHGNLTGVAAGDHHTATVAGDIALADLSEKLHASLASVGGDDHHNESHAVLSHSDGATSLHYVEGTYCGDGGISQVVSGLGVLPKMVWITRDMSAENSDVAPGERGMLITWTNYIAQDSTGGAFSFADVTPHTFLKNGIIAVASGSITVDDNGADQHPNKNAIVYRFAILGVKV